MTIPPIPSPLNLFLLPALPAVSSASGVTATLRPEQLVRALVVAATTRDELLLEIGQERFRAVGSRPLQPGQVIDLRIVQTTPRLEALVVNNRLQEQLAVRLPSLSQPFDWSGLFERLQRPELAPQLSPPQQTLVNQLHQLLDPGQGANTVLREQVQQLVAQLSSLRHDDKVFFRGTEPAPVNQQRHLLDLRQGTNTVLREQIHQLVAQLRSLRHDGEVFFRRTEPAPVNQQRQLLDPGLGRFAAVREQADQMVVLQRQTILIDQGSARTATPPPGVIPANVVVLPAASSPALVATAEQSRQIVRLLGRLQAQFVPLIELGGEKMSKDWQRTTAEVFAQLRQYADTRSLPALRTPEWTQALQLLRHHPGVTEQISQQAVKLLAQLEPPGGAPLALLAPPQPAAGTGASIPLAAHHLTPLPPAQLEVYRALQPLLQELKGLLGMGSAAPRSAAVPNVPLAPDLLGRIEGLSTQIHQLLTREGIAPLLQEGLQLVAVQLQQLTVAPPTPARGEALGFLSQFFGLHLERELLLGKQKQALTNLKQTLLALQQKSGEDLREPLSRIELFQLCKARFSEAQLQFLPLPMVGLSDGYLLAGRREAEEQDDPGRKPKEEVQISLSLRLSGLGSMRVDLNLLPDQGLVVRLACEDRHKMEYLKGCEEELAGALTQMKLRQIHYSADARHPLQQLQQSLLPHRNTLLDTRA